MFGTFVVIGGGGGAHESIKVIHGNNCNFTIDGACVDNVVGPGGHGTAIGGGDGGMVEVVFGAFVVGCFLVLHELELIEEVWVGSVG